MSEAVESMQDEARSSLPANWARVRLPEISTINPTLDKSEIDDDLSVSFVPMPAVEAETGKIDVSTPRPFAEVRKGYTGFLEGDVLFAKITPCMENGKMAVVPALKNDLGFGSTEFHVLRPAGGTSPDYLYYFVSSKAFRIEAEHNMTGAVGQRRVPAAFLDSSEIPLPPAAEQQRIVAKLEELFSELDKGVESLRTAQQQLKVYRQALLKHAFEGKLTAEWRAQNPDKLESAEALLARIQKEREARYQQQLAEWQEAQQAWEAAGKTGSKPAKPKAPKVLPTLTAEELAELPELPEGWCWCRIAELADTGTGVTPLKSRQDFYTGGTIPWVTSGALNDAYVDQASDFVTEVAIEETGLRMYPAGTLLLAMYGEGKTRGKSAELRINATTNQAIAAISLSEASEPVKPYLKWFLVKNYDEIRRLSSGGVQPNLNLGIVEATKFPFCSLQEQEEICNVLEVCMSQADQLEQTITTSLQQAEALRQSILKKAFSGQLVPQNPDDEPASVLLERIRAERDGQQPSPRRGRPRRAAA